MPSTTFVTSLFDCFKGTDYKANDLYFARSLRTLYINEPMVIFCEPHYVAKFLGIRAAFGYHQTKIVPMTLEETHMYKYRDQIPKRSGRDIPNLVVGWNAKPQLLYSVVQSNPFNTTHFAWIDINHLSKHPHNSLNYIKEDVYDRIHKIARNPHDKFTIMLLNAWTPSLYEDLNQYYSFYKFICTTGFYMTDMETGLFMLPKVIELTEQHVKAGNLWGDEHIFAPLIDQYEDKFTFLLVDYQDTFDNYFSLETDHSYIENNLINSHINHGLNERITRILNEYKTRDTVKSFNYDKYLSC